MRKQECNDRDGESKHATEWRRSSVARTIPVALYSITLGPLRHIGSVANGQFIGRFLRGVACGRGSPADRRSLVRFRRSPQSASTNGFEKRKKKTPLIRARCRRTCVQSAACSTASRRSRSPLTRPRRSSTSSCVLRRRPHPRSRRTPRRLLSFDIAGEERLLQDVTDEALAQGVWVACRGTAEYLPRCHGCAVAEGV